MTDDPVTGSFDQPNVRTWPPGRELTDEECVELACATCQTHWRVHDRMRGFKLRCSCEQWLEVPGAPAPEAEQLADLTEGRIPVRSDPQMPATYRERRDNTDKRGLIEVPGEAGDVIYSPIPTNAQMAPGTLQRASQSNQRRWTNRTLLEFVALMGALLVPQLLAFLLADGNEFTLLLPFASLMSGVLVAIVVAWAGPYGRMGMRGAPPRHFVEAIAAAGIGVLLAMAYSYGLQQLLPEIEGGLNDITERLGLIASLFVIAVTPAVLEEIIFRGMLQGRLMALFGRSTGYFVTAAAFAIVHGQPAVLPIHLGIGLYLGWLRERSGSLLPCMLMHFLYNGTLVGLEFYSAQ